MATVSTAQPQVPAEILRNQEELRRRHEQKMTQAEQAAEQDYEAALVSPLEPVFFFVFSLAFLADAIDIVLELLGIVVVPKLIGIVLDVLTLPIGWWVAQRTGAIISANEQRDQMKEQRAQQMVQHAGRLGEQAQKAKSRLATTQNPARKAWRKMILFFILELIPFVGLIPFWTIAVIGTLRAR